MAFDVAEREFGIKPFITGKELVSGQEPDKTSMSAYLSKFYELFRGTPLPPAGRPALLLLLSRPGPHYTTVHPVYAGLSK